MTGADLSEYPVPAPPGGPWSMSMCSHQPALYPIHPYILRYTHDATDGQWKMAPGIARRPAHNHEQVKQSQATYVCPSSVATLPHGAKQAKVQVSVLAALDGIVCYGALQVVGGAVVLSRQRYRQTEYIPLSE